ncbi:Crp/Fnr family transcriptional regulator [Aerococcaceae bacterium DSM 111020]|nr:Crp/Fnr family transcriptional regulator [Aerococcaceae bacterium DSM 111020]
MTENRNKAKYNCVHLVPIFNHLSHEQLTLIGSKVKHKRLDKLDYLFQPGDQSNAIYIVNTGQVKIFRMVESGKEQMIRVLKPGDFIGETGIFNPDEVFEDYAQVMMETTICTIYQEDLLQIMADYHEVSLQIVRELSNRLRSADQHTTYISTEKVGTRIALYLANLVQAEEVNVEVTLPMSKKDIASYLGTTPETISRKFKQLEDEGLINQISHNRILIHDVDDLLFYSE